MHRDWDGGVLEFEGMFTDRDDRNDGPVPYTFVRKQGFEDNFRTANVKRTVPRSLTKSLVRKAGRFS